MTKLDTEPSSAGAPPQRSGSQDTNQTTPTPTQGERRPKPSGGSLDGKPIALSEGVELLGEYEGSAFKEPRFLVRRPDGQVVQFTELLYRVVESVDGSKNAEQIAETVSRSYGKQVGADDVRTLVEKHMIPSGLIAGTKEAETAKQLEGRPDAAVLKLRLKFTIVPERAVNAIALLFKPLLWPPVMVAGIAGLIAVDVWYFGTHGVGQGIRQTVYEPLTMLALYGLLVLSVFFHEVGHATACRYGGAKPGRIGFGIYVVWPAFFTDVTDVYRLGRGGRVRTALGGLYFNALYAIAAAGMYFLTGWEPLLLLIIAQHLLIVYQFLPFLRLDGYYVISDLLGVPDLFARVRPALRSLVPGKDGGKKIDELKPWARVVVSAWVMITIPLLLFMFSMMVIRAPRVVATAWDSSQILLDQTRQHADAGSGAGIALGGLQLALLALPLLGMTITFSRVALRIGGGAVKITEERPVARGALALVAVAALGFGAYTLIPNGEYRPIAQGERWTFSENVATFDEVSEGRPGFTEEEAERYEGSPFRAESQQHRNRTATATDPQPTPSPTSEPTSDPTAVPTTDPTASPTPTSSPTPTPA